MEIGIDIVEIDRIKLNNDHFIKRVLTNKEYEIFDSLNNDTRRKEYIASRFAVKEAYMKAKKVGLGSISFQDIEVLNDEFGAPYLNDPHAKVSISHEIHYAVAIVLIENT